MPALSTAELVKVQLVAENMWRENGNSANDPAEVNALKAIRENQTALITPLQNVGKNYKVRLNWLDDSAIIATKAGETNGGQNCELSGPELGAEGKDLALDSFYKSEFSVNEDDLRNSSFSFEQVMAQGITTSLKVLDEKVSEVTTAKVDTFKGVNVFPGQFTYDAATSQTNVPAASLNASFFAYLQQAMVLNRMRNSYLIDNGSLTQQRLIAMANMANGEGKGAAALFGSLKIYEDMFSMAAAGLTTDILMLNRGSVAFASTTKYGPIPTEYGGTVQQTRWSVPSPSLVEVGNTPAVRYDAYYSLECITPPAVGGGEAPEEQIRHVWRFIARFGAFSAPTPKVLGFNIQ